MVTRISQSEEDLNHLRLKTAVNSTRDDTDYKGVVIEKPWGYEYLALENNDVAVWILFLNEGDETSLHCHPNKKTSLSVLSGSIQFRTTEKTMQVKCGEGVLIENGVFHSSRAVSSPGAIIIETETPNDKKDLVRLNDKYGRAGKSYEGKEFHKKPNQNLFEYVDFHNREARYGIRKKIGQCELAVINLQTAEDFTKIFETDDNFLCVVLNGALNGNHRLALGDISHVKILKNFRPTDIIENTELLLIYPKLT